MIDCDPHWYTRRVKETIHLRLYPNNVNWDSGIQNPEVWMLIIKKKKTKQNRKKSTTREPYDSRPPREQLTNITRIETHESWRRGLCKVPSFKKCGLITTYMARLKQNISTRFPSLPLVQAISIFHCNVSLQRKPLISRATG